MKAASIIALLVVGATASPISQRPHVVHERRHVLHKWQAQDATVPQDLQMPMRIALKESNMDRFEEFLMKVSDPDSPEYGRHYTAPQIVQMFKPTKETTEAVHGWLVDSGIDSTRIRLSDNLAWLEFKATVKEAEHLLKTKYSLYKHRLGHERVGTMEYSIPVDVSSHIDFITPTLHFDIQESNPIPMQGLTMPEPETAPRKIEKRKLISHLHMGGALPEADAADSVTGSAPIATPTLGTQGGSTVTSSVAASAVPSGAIPPQNLSATDTSDCVEYVTPICLRTLYDFFPGNVSINSNVSYGIVEYGNLSYLINDDLTNFMGKFISNATNFLPTTYLIDGAIQNQTNIPSVNNTANFGLHGEANLDFEYGVALAYPVPVNYYQLGSTTNLGGFGNFLDAIDGSYCSFEGGNDVQNYSGIFFDDPAWNSSQCGAFPSSNIISTSYGSDELDMTAAYEQRQCQEYGKLGMMGISVGCKLDWGVSDNTKFFFSSGDAGVASEAGCIDPNVGPAFNATSLVDGLTYTNGSYGLFVPSWPVTCPYITAVGATQISPGNSVSDPEAVANVLLPQADGSVFDFSSGGGFSNNFAIPSYQSDAVSSYLTNYGNATGQPSPSVYNSTGMARGYPDITANGANYTILLGGQWNYVFGTSASCPVVAAIFSHINNARLNAGKSAVGFVNPTLYKNAAALNDITSGNNPGCGTQGFSAEAGWDPASGLGTPNYPKLLDVFMNLQ